MWEAAAGELSEIVGGEIIALKYSKPSEGKDQGKELKLCGDSSGVAAWRFFFTAVGKHGRMGSHIPKAGLDHDNQADCTNHGGAIQVYSVRTSLEGVEEQATSEELKVLSPRPSSRFKSWLREALPISM